MGAIRAIFKRELGGYFATPIAYVFLTIFVLLSGVFTFYVGNFLQLGQADLRSFFLFHPWLYLFLIPALAMRLWAEERRGGTIELLLTLPVTMSQAVLGKFLAAWAVGIAGFTPIPYKVFTISAGAFEIDFLVFLIASALSRSARFFIEAALIHRFGPPIRSFIDRRFNLLTILFIVLLLGGFLLFKGIF